MFAPSMILEDVAVFGLYETIGLVSARFRRLGKSARMADIMARRLVHSVVFVPE